MDELDLLKKDWKKQNADYPKLTYNEIYKLIHKKSSSVVKWIFIICIAEFILGGLINLIIPESVLVIYEKFNLKTLLYISYTIHYIVIIGFIYLFYRNYNAICVIDNTNLLMKKIIKTRKTVNYYIYYVIIFNIVISLIFSLIMFSNTDLLLEVMNPNHHAIDNDKLFKIIMIVYIIVFLLMVGFLWLYYRIIYGILLKRLNKNYKELETLE